MPLLQLSSELLCEIIRHLQQPLEQVCTGAWREQKFRAQIAARKDLKNLRLTCKAFVDIAAARLYRTVHLAPTASAVRKWHLLADAPNLTHHVRRLVFHTGHWDPYLSHEHLSRRSQEDRDIGSSWLLDLERMHCFPRIKSFEFRFQDCYDNIEERVYSLSAYDFGYRTALLSGVLYSMKSFNKQTEGKITSLTIARMMSKIADEEGLRSLSAVQKHLRELHVSMWAEPNTSTRDDMDHGFWPAFTTQWLLPVAARLTSLSLYVDSSW